MQNGCMTCSAVTNQCSPQPSTFPTEWSPLCANAIWLLFHSVCVRRERWNLWLYVVLFKREVSFSGPMQMLLMILVLWCYVKHDVKDAWQECWGGKRVRRAASPPPPPPPHPPPLLTALMSYSWLSAANLWFLLNASWAVLHITHQAPGTEL